MIWIDFSKQTDDHSGDNYHGIQFQRVWDSGVVPRVPVPKIAKTGLSALISSRVHYYHEGTRFPE